MLAIALHAWTIHGCLAFAAAGATRVGAAGASAARARGRRAARAAGAAGEARVYACRTASRGEGEHEGTRDRDSHRANNLRNIEEFGRRSVGGARASTSSRRTDRGSSMSSAPQILQWMTRSRSGLGSACTMRGELGSNAHRDDAGAAFLDLMR
ncbi:hypothetical protein A7982_12780 [Minicystis rosea]|nr:hypothetical protein A7982_12780 [Minicystis rosea]